MGAECLLALVAAVVKTAATDIPLEMLVFFRNLFGLLALSPLLLKSGFSTLRTRVIHIHLFRATVGLTAMYCFFYTFAHIKLADALVLKLSAPLFVPLIAWLWMREALTGRILAAAGVGFLGVVLVINPTKDVWASAALVGLLGSFFAAFAKVSVRRLTRSEPAVTIVFYFATIATLISAGPMLINWVTPSTDQWLLLMTMGALATGAQLLMTRGFAAAPAGRVAVFGYSSVLFGLAFGWLFWDETWGWQSLAGACLIVAGGLLALRVRASKQLA